MSDAPAVLVRRSAAEHLVREVRRVLDAPGAKAPYVRVEVEADADAAPLAWLAAQPHTPRLYWHGRGQAVRVACAGAALSVADDARALTAWLDRLGPDARFYGGFRFDPGRPLESGAWRSDERFRLTLPRLTLTGAGAGAVLACHLVFPRDAGRRSEVLRALRLMAPPGPLPAALPLPESRRDLPDAAAWRATVAAALRAFEAGPMGKVVLARRVTFGFGEPLDPFALLARLEAATPGAFHFLTAHGPGAAFLGASPERLFRQDGRCVWTEAVAGTRPRGETHGEDAAFEAELMESEKDAREHSYVRDFLAAHLAPLATELRVDDAPEAMPQARVVHLRTRLEATLRTGVRPLDVLAALHPTPAVGGTPTDAALAFLRAHEPFDRGRYAAPVGWMSRDAAEFAVGLRAGRVEGRTLSLYSGAGVVAGSDAEREWAEIESKIGDFAAALGLQALH
jgi:menaquinone-specific isochorismate synthase